MDGLPVGQNGNGLKTDKNGNRTEIKRERNGITRPVVRTGDGNFFLMPAVAIGVQLSAQARGMHSIYCSLYCFLVCFLEGIRTYVVCHSNSSFSSFFLFLLFVFGNNGTTIEAMH